MKTAYKTMTIVLALALVLTAGAAAQDFTIDEMKTAFKDFSGDVASSLPYASTLGGTWSDAKVRGFPHFGAGLTVGMVMLPEDAFNDLASALGESMPKEIEDAGLGVPLPGYAFDARLGLPVLPFDIGAKFGYMHPALGDAIESSTGVKADYLLAGVDIRYPVIKQKLLIPSVAVSAGVNYLTGGVDVTPDSTISSIDVNSIDGVTGTIDFTDPDVRFNWQSTSLDFRVHASEKLLLFTFYGGGGYSYGISKAGGGLTASWENNTNISDPDLKQALKDAGYDVSAKEVSVLSDANGGTFHAFAGFSVDLLILRLDLQGKYNFMSQKLGAALNARVQF